MRVVLAPWRDSGCPWRQRSRDLVLEHWSSWADVHVGEPDDGPFNRSQALNRAAAAAGAWDIALLVDLDVITPHTQADIAVEIAAGTGRLVLAFDRLMLLPRSRTQQAHDGRPLTAGSPVAGHVSCAVVVTRELWDTVGGFDERFRGWGAEDRAFHAACTTLGPRHGLRVDGFAWHLWHPRSAERTAVTPEHRANVALADRYREAGAQFDGGFLARRGRTPDPLRTDPDPEAMRSLLSEPGGPLDIRAED